MVKIIENLLPESAWSVGCPYSMTPEFIVVHNTYNDASARNEVSYMHRNYSNVSYHFAVDDKEIIQAVPLNRNSWHAGDGWNGRGNRKGISIEICYSKSGGQRFLDAEKLAVKLIVHLLKKYNWGVDRVKKHQDFMKKYCPHRTLDLGWGRFLDMVKSELNGSKSVESTKIKEFEVMERLKDEKYLISGNFSVDSLPWGCDDRKNLGNTKDWIGKVVTVTRKWGSYWYVKELGGFVDHRAFEKAESVDINSTIKSGGFSIDSLPWGMKGFEKLSTTSQYIGKNVKLIARYSAYYLADGLGWIDEKAFGFNKKEEKKSAKKSVKEIAREVLEGKWKNYPERKRLLEKAGYDYEEVQKEVNKISN